MKAGGSDPQLLSGFAEQGFWQLPSWGTERQLTADMQVCMLATNGMATEEKPGTTSLDLQTRNT